MKKLDQLFLLIKTTHKIFLVYAIILVWVFFGCSNGWDIQNPYENVDWNNHKQYKANLHTHTTRSDGRMNPHEVVDKYHQLGYHILAVTDHNRVTWPWNEFADMEPSPKSKERQESGELQTKHLNYENRDPNQLGMVAVQGNETGLSRHHHIGSFFNDHNDTATVDEYLPTTAVNNKNGLVIFMHPGRYTTPTRDPKRKERPHVNADWYVNYFRQCDHIIGMEVYRARDSYPYDRQLWDSILYRLMPERPVWGFSNDDMHSKGGLGYNWNIFVLPELSERWVRRGMEEGRFLFVYAPDGHSGADPASIGSIEVDRRKGTIEINATGQDSIRWISAGNVVHKGNILELKNNSQISGYVRAKIYGPGEIITGTQPFGCKPAR